MTQRLSLPWSASAFEHRYRKTEDPWNFATSPYERNRYQTILSALMRPAYGRAFEPGCSIGELTVLLSGRCESVLATDVSASAVATAKRRCAGLSNVEIRREQFSDATFPKEAFDLIVLSELMYYLSSREAADVSANIHKHLLPGGELVAVHWLGHSNDHQLHGDQVYNILTASVQLQWAKGMRHKGFRIDSWKQM